MCILPLRAASFDCGRLTARLAGDRGDLPLHRELEKGESLNRGDGRVATGHGRAFSNRAIKPFDFRKQVMNHYRMKDLDTLTITEKGQAQFPASWRKQAGLMRGGPCDVRVLDDGRQSLLITPRPQKRRGAVGLLAHLEDQAVAFPKVERHTMPFK
jgi:bifunctional DNA-binding transcriptional regulator/antitoxin component of YhaV-PrlF toxin-antitoxin module